MSNDDTISDEELAEALAGKASLLERGDRDRAQVIEELVELVADSPETSSREGRVDSSGRVSIGRRFEGVNGVVVFYADPATHDPDD